VHNRVFLAHDKRVPMRKIDNGVINRVSLHWVAICLATTAFFAVTLWLNLSVRTEQQFSLLAQSFLHGRLDLIEPPNNGGWDDTTPVGDRHYWPLGPLPAVLLIPFQFLAGLFGKTFFQGYLQIALVIAVFALAFRIGRRIGYDQTDSFYIAFGFCFATAFLGVAVWPWSWYFSQVITCAVLLVAILEITGKARPLVIGSLFAICLATRATAALGLLWFIGETLSSANRSLQQKLRAIGMAILPGAIVLLLLLIYNYARFGNPFDQGYAGQIIPEAAAKARSIGLFSLQHVPANLYALFLASPVPIFRADGAPVLTFPFFAANPWGMSLFVTAPWLVVVFFGLHYRDARSRWIFLTVCVIALPLLFYYAVGYRQFGYRYSLDFLPLLLYLLFRNYHAQRGALSLALKLVFLVSALWNLHLFAGHYLWHLT